MSMLTRAWIRFPLHRRREGHSAAVGRRWRAPRAPEIVAAAALGWAVLAAVLFLVSRTVFGMSAGAALGFSLGVAAYILLFTGFILALAWCVVTNRLDLPHRW
jgi:VIT1/CCC1 family predicted Fe2+/Mn2+ transporter